MGAIRGAVCAENTDVDISNKAVELIREIFIRNDLCPQDIEAVIFSVTEDLDACYPAKAVREVFSMGDAAFMCLSEMSVCGSIDHCIRVCVFVRQEIRKKQSQYVHCYLGKAKALREDLSNL